MGVSAKLEQGHGIGSLLIRAHSSHNLIHFTLSQLQPLLPRDEFAGNSFEPLLGV
jgi:hypothetical protein